MQDDGQADRNKPLSPRDVELWTRQEITDANRAHALRIKELTDIAKACSSGELSAKEANELHDRYYERWGDALPTISVGPNTTDEQIMRSLDEAATQRKADIRRRTEGRYR